MSTSFEEYRARLRQGVQQVKDRTSFDIEPIWGRQEDRDKIWEIFSAFHEQYYGDQMYPDPIIAFDPEVDAIRITPDPTLIKMWEALAFDFRDRVIKKKRVGSVASALARGAPSVNKIEYDAVNGKLAEYAAYEIIRLVHHYPGNIFSELMTPPDTLVYGDDEKDVKSWLPDFLITRGEEIRGFEVKMCTTDVQTPSWVVNYGNRDGSRDMRSVDPKVFPEFFHDLYARQAALSDYVERGYHPYWTRYFDGLYNPELGCIDKCRFLGLTRDKNDFLLHCAVSSLDLIHHGLRDKLPKKPDLQKSKRVIYKTDVAKLSPLERWGEFVKYIPEED